MSESSERRIFHVDMDAFFVSVEELLRPELVGKPVVVGGRPDARGVVSAASYAARAFGVHSALPLRTAAKLCPQAIFLDGHPKLYREYSHRVHEVLTRFSPRVEMASVDEAYLDLTGTERLLGPVMRAAQALHDGVKEATGLNCSIGISRSKMVAKVASDQSKPNGALWVQPGLEAEFLAPLAVGKIPGVGKVTERRLAEMGVRLVSDLARLEENFLRERFGQWGLALAGKARGKDAGAWFDGTVSEAEHPKSISHEHTFGEDSKDQLKIEAVLSRQMEKVGHRLREQGLFARTVELKLRYEGFETLTRSKTLGEASQLDQQLIRTVRDLFREAWQRGRAVRLVGAGVSQLVEHEGQLGLLGGEQEERAKKAQEAADRIRAKFGDKLVGLGSGLTGETAERVHENPVGLPGKTQKRGD